jgi:hypothetical protein
MHATLLLMLDYCSQNNSTSIQSWLQSTAVGFGDNVLW